MWMESGKIQLLSARHMASRDGEVLYRSIAGQAARRSKSAASPASGEQCFWPSIPHPGVCDMFTRLFVMTKIGKWLSTQWDSKEPERRLGFLDGKMMSIYCEVEEARCGKCTEGGVCVSIYMWVYLACVCKVVEVRKDHSSSRSGQQGVGSWGSIWDVVPLEC